MKCSGSYPKSIIFNHDMVFLHKFTSVNSIHETTPIHIDGLNAYALS